MSRLLPPVPSGVKIVATLVLTLTVCASAFAVDVDPKLDRALHELMPVCSDATVKYEELTIKLPPRFKGALASVTNPSKSCDAMYAAVIAPSGSVFIGAPWPLTGQTEKTIEDKLKGFTWQNMHENMTAIVDRTRTADGLFPVTLEQATTSGKLPMPGLVDPDGTVFFFGRFRGGSEDLRTARLRAFEPYLDHAPAKGAANPKVTILEFSDFQCPSCQRAAGYLDPILEKHGDAVRYIRFDLPLTMHNWAFGAALAGRAIYRQSPELFWEYKHQIYSNQSSLSPFTFWDFARNFVKDHDLDLAKYDADLENVDIKKEILGGAGTALTNDIRATPSYMVNGSLVDPGPTGKELAEYVDRLLAAK